MDYLGKVEVLTNTDLNKFVNKILEKAEYMLETVLICQKMPCSLQEPTK